MSSVYPVSSIISCFVWTRIEKKRKTSVGRLRIDEHAYARYMRGPVWGEGKMYALVSMKKKKDALVGRIRPALTRWLKHVCVQWEWERSALSGSTGKLYVYGGAENHDELELCNSSGHKCRVVWADV
ncbi:hypothetical protein FRC12_021965 [Ceratobasidium sp. 428]|nr:hypothetical protein FRC12_021965 [Ceratobasidium sp. 428]